MSGFQTKQEELQVDKLLDQDQNVVDTIIEEDVAPHLRDEPLLGPTPDITPELNHAADPSALRHWLDDLSEYADQHRGEAKAAELLDEIACNALDELAQKAKDHRNAELEAGDEQSGFISDFVPDSAIEAAAMDTHKPDAPVEIDDVKPVIDDGDWGLNGGGGGAGGAPPPGGLPEEAAPGAPEPPPDAGDKGKEKGRVGKLVDRVFRRETAQQKPIKDPDKPKK